MNDWKFSITGMSIPFCKSNVDGHKVAHNFDGLKKPADAPSMGLGWRWFLASNNRVELVAHAGIATHQRQHLVTHEEGQAAPHGNVKWLL